MADVASTCLNGNPVVSGRVVVRKGIFALNVIEPKIDRQCPVAQLEVLYTASFDSPRYYSGDTPN